MDAPYVGGRTIRTVKEQLNRLAAADFRLGVSQDCRSITIKGTVIEGLELWTPKDARQRVLWPTHVQFSTHDTSRASCSTPYP